MPKMGVFWTTLQSRKKIGRKEKIISIKAKLLKDIQNCFCTSILLKNIYLRDILKNGPKVNTSTNYSRFFILLISFCSVVYPTTLINKFNLLLYFKFFNLINLFNLSCFNENSCQSLSYRIFYKSNQCVCFFFQMKLVENPNNHKNILWKNTKTKIPTSCDQVHYDIRR